MAKISKTVVDADLRSRVFANAIFDKNDEIQWVEGSSKKTRYFRTDKYVNKAVDYHNRLYPEDIWKVRRCLIVEDVPDNGCI